MGRRRTTKFRILEKEFNWAKCYSSWSQSWPSDVNIFASWTQYDSLPRATKFLLEYVSFFESTLIFDIFANQRFCCILRKLIFRLQKTVFSCFPPRPTTAIFMLIWGRKYSVNIISWSNFGARLQAVKPYRRHITFCRNAISIEHTASHRCLCHCLLRVGLPFRERNKFLNPKSCILCKMSVFGSFLKYSYNLAKFSLDIPL